MMKLKTQPSFNGYAIEFSPFEERRFAVATAQNFGIIGNGKQYIMDVHERGEIIPFREFDSRDGLFDCSWSEENDTHIVASSGDGSLKLWDIHARDNMPLRHFHEHEQEASSVDWNIVRKDCFVSGSWDHSIKIWNPRMNRSINTFREHQYCVYSTIWSPRSPDVFASVSGDCTMKIWNQNV
eukprot:TRINITY_DN4515_c0_g1_i1.p1 TRINITY_DN4515_c0_g1~~TRINITY_DN4515_c0_g1_i1.p1  ORF type:complete len:182 (-),score=34.52 TRINITY_DN4515_c0_g1_i1:473-1018(-)